MVKHYSKKRRLKYVLLALACTTAFTLSGMAAACKKDNTPDDSADKTTSKEDTQLLKNGNFEFFTVPENAVYLINTPTNWSHGGTSSYTMSGIIGTSDAAWDKLTASDLAEKLDYNNSLNSSADNYKDLHVDYNGMKSSDILYKDTYAALNAKDSDSGEGEGEADKTETDPKALIDNPGTHYNVRKSGDKLVYTDENGEEKPVYVDENGDYFADEALKTPISHVLMLHNYATTRNGIAQDYSSVSVDMPANTAAEISLWVKTAELKYNNGKKVEQDLGAYISVTNTVGSSNLDNFTINCINTEKLLDGKEDKYNGWVQYTVYVNACDFASSTISIELGLGESTNGDTVEGYAFFDDVQVTKYLSLDKSSYGDDTQSGTVGYEIRHNNNYSYNSGSKIIKNRSAYSTLSSDKSEKIFKADSYVRNDVEMTKGFSECFKYLLDLASEDTHDVFHLTGATAGLTVDEDEYATANSFGGKLLGFTSSPDASGAKLPKDFTARDTSNDLLALVKADHKFTSNDTDYFETLTTALAKATELPKIDATADMLVMLSANGAAYTASTTVPVDPESYYIISFWVKTSNEGTATVKVYEKDNDENTSSFTVNTKDSAVNIDDDNKDVYDGWAQCFLFVKNELKDTAKNIVIDFSFGNTTIKDTSASAYKPGWIALTNAQFFETDKDTFAHTGSGTYTASLTISEEEEKTLEKFDEVYGSQQHAIENAPAKPANYEGVNGGSSYIINNGSVTLPFDDIDTNASAGLINKDYVNTYDSADWYNKVLTSFGATSTTAIGKWNEVFGTSSVQPLIILNDSLRNYYCENKKADKDTYKTCYTKDDDGKYVQVGENDEYDENKTYYTRKQALNYGFIAATDKTFAADSYTTVSVKVKVSAGAVAYIYLTETSNGKSVIKYTAPSYTFRYDVDGNVLKADLKDDATLAEQKANVLYYLRDDGLYEDKDGKLFANTWNYKRVYKDRGVSYYDKDGNAVNFENLVDGETYYKADKTEADCFLVATVNGKEEKIYEFRGEKYYYIVNGKSTVEVTPFDTEYAKYDRTELAEEFKAVIDARNDETGKEATVNFVIHTGSESKSYRLELWSGSRESTGVDKEGNVTKDASALGSCVIFDYSYYKYDDDTVKNAYESEIITAYQRLLSSKGLLKGAPTSTENIDYYRNLVKGFIDSGELTQADIDGVEILKNYTAYYYNYSFYDSVNFKPFNKDVADANSTGYEYTYENDEKLAYLQVKDGDKYYVFADYGVLDHSINTGTASDGGDTDNGDKDKNNTTVWLLISSIVLVVAMLFALMAILVKDMIKKSRRNKVSGKNNYQQRNRYMRKLRITADEYDEVENPAATESESAEAPAENVEAQPATETVAEPADEQTAEEVAEPSEEVTETTEAPAESGEAATESEQGEQPADESDKPAE
ncbi:MAG: hypothetical protein K2K60_02185 [Clostridia bacterium]|nr:hypothetical protein [Clostridia bacterium]